MSDSPQDRRSFDRRPQERTRDRYRRDAIRSALGAIDQAEVQVPLAGAGGRSELRGRLAQLGAAIPPVRSGRAGSASEGEAALDVPATATAPEVESPALPPVEDDDAEEVALLAEPASRAAAPEADEVAALRRELQQARDELAALDVRYRIESRTAAELLQRNQQLSIDRDRQAAEFESSLRSLRAEMRALEAELEEARAVEPAAAAFQPEEVDDGGPSLAALQQRVVELESELQLRYAEVEHASGDTEALRARLREETETRLAAEEALHAVQEELAYVQSEVLSAGSETGKGWRPFRRRGREPLPRPQPRAAAETMAEDEPEPGGDAEDEVMENLLERRLFGG